MALVQITNPETQEFFEYYLDDRLKRQLDKKVMTALKKKDEDYVILVDGKERSGKSTFGFQIGRYIDPTLSLDRICFDPNKFRQAIIGAKKHQCIVFDEAYRGLSSRGVLTEVNRILVSLMMEMGQKNLCVIIILPTFFLLEKYVALWRTRGLFHITRKNGKKGYWRFFNEKKKRIIYMKGKREYGYQYAKSRFRGRFYGKWAVNEQEYKKKKELSLKQGYKTTRSEKWKEQRDNLLRLLYKEHYTSLRKLSEAIKFYNVKLTAQNLGEIVSVRGDAPQKSVK